jgi:hypothetical protein
MEIEMLKKTLVAAAAVLAVGLGTVGSAHALTISAGEYQFLIGNFDAGTVNYGVGSPVCSTVAACDISPGIIKPAAAGTSSYDTMGIFSVTQIKNLTTAQTIFTAGPDGFITGVFGQLADHRVDRGVIGASDLTQTRSVGGVWAMYQNATDYDFTLGQSAVGSDFLGTLNDPLSLKYPGITAGSPFLSGIFVPGAIAGDIVTTYTSTFSSDTFAGGGQGFMNVTGGSAKDQFDTTALPDANGVKRDMFLNVTFDDVNGQAAANNWTVSSAGQLKGNAIPEPGALALSALALIAAGLASRRRASA